LGQGAAGTDQRRQSVEGSLSDDISVDEYKSVFEALELRFGMKKVRASQVIFSDTTRTV